MLLHNDVSIAAGDSESVAMSLREHVIVGVHVPSVWTTASISFLVSETETGTYVPAYDAAGTELVLTTGTSRFIVVPPDATRGMPWVKLRSGIQGAAVVQVAAAVLKVAVADAVAS